MNKKIAVLIVDDSAVVRQAISSILSSDAGIEVLGTAADPLFAMPKMLVRWPDVIVLDIEMPRMDGLTFLKKIMAEHPTPVVICSTLTPEGSETALAALSAGAVSIISKPDIGIRRHLMEDVGKQLIEEVKAAAKTKIRYSALLQPLIPAPKLSADAILPSSTTLLQHTTERIVALGASTGGTVALEQVLMHLPRVSPGIVVVQHMPETFTAAFAARLDSVCAIEVREAKHFDRIVPGRVLIAPGGRHMIVRRSGAQYHVELLDGPPVNRHRPSVDVLFRSVAQAAGKNALGVIMTGMGDDGARGLLEMRQQGALTLAQDEKTCVVYGMPKEAVRMGACERSISLEHISSEVLQFWLAQRK